MRMIFISFFAIGVAGVAWVLMLSAKQLWDQKHDKAAQPRTFKIVLAHDGRPTHAWTVTEGERTIITDPLVASLVASGHWSIEVRPC